MNKHGREISFFCLLSCLFVLLSIHSTSLGLTYSYRHADPPSKRHIDKWMNRKPEFSAYAVLDIVPYRDRCPKSVGVAIRGENLINDGRCLKLNRFVKHYELLKALNLQVNENGVLDFFLHRVE